jgi:hypothetical protein
LSTDFGFKEFNVKSPKERIRRYRRDVFVKATISSDMKYCKVAYTANLRHFKGAIEKEMSGLEMYKRLADGRHERLVELPNDL